MWTERLLPGAIFIDMSAVVTATFYVATISMHNLLKTVAKLLACLQHHVWSKDVVPLLKRNIEQTITSNNTMFTFHMYCLDSLLQGTWVWDPFWSTDHLSKEVPGHEVQWIEVRGVCWLVELIEQCSLDLNHGL